MAFIFTLKPGLRLPSIQKSRVLLDQFMLTVDIAGQLFSQNISGQKRIGLRIDIQE